MADTGPPWFIPFVEPTDIPRTYPQDSEDLADAIAAGLSAAGNPGIGSNVVQTVKTDTFTTTSDTFVEVTGLNVSITPSSLSSKVLVIAQVAYGTNNDDGDPSGRGSTVVKMTRGGTDIYIGDTDGSAIRAVWGGSTNLVSIAEMLWSGSIVYLDSPNTTSATTYRIETRRSEAAGAAFINTPRLGQARGASSITAIEVAA